MTITENQLRDIVRNVLEEAISRSDSRLANRFIRQDKGAGYTARQAGPGNVFDMVKRSLGGRIDSNGQMDILRSANEIYPLIQKYNAEIKKLTTVYNYLNARKDGNYVPKSRIARKPMSADQKARMLASRAANAQQRAAINAQYGDIDAPSYTTRFNGSIDPTTYNAARSRMGGYRNDVASKGNQTWFAESLFNFGNQNDEIEQICQTYKTMKPEQMAAAAEKVGARLQEYKATVAKLQGMLDKWQSSGKLIDRNAEARAKRDAELKNVGKQGVYRPAANLEESINNIVSNVLRKYLK